ncbi:hypothetical protein [Algoriphagus aquimarinus]|uniref:hypothetical protein n=1 Tax=Algoriphagus aquimarinus TaxID=237018 RepID=UPI0030D97EF3
MQTETLEEILCYDAILKTIKERNEIGGSILQILANKKLKEYKLTIDNSTYKEYLKNLVDFGFITGNDNYETNQTDYGLIKYGPLSLIDYITFSENKDRHIKEQLDFLRENDFQPTGKKYPFHFKVKPREGKDKQSKGYNFSNSNFNANDLDNSFSASFLEPTYQNNHEKSNYKSPEEEEISWFSILKNWIYFILFLCLAAIVILVGLVAGAYLIGIVSIGTLIYAVYLFLIDKLSKY